VYRERDAALRVGTQAGPLESLLAVIAEQGAVVDGDVMRLYDDWFIETCQEWLAPYIGDLLAVRYLNPVTAATVSARAFVANTLRYRRAKGTVALLELLASDVTGWRARAVEFFQLLETTQYAKHIRIRNRRTPNLRDTATLELLGGAFDSIAHTAEARSPVRGGRYSIPNVGIHLWRLEAFPLSRVTPRPAQGHPLGFNCSPLGLDQQLFNPAPDAPPADRLATELDVPEPLRRRPLYDELEAHRAASASPLVYFDPSDPVLRVFGATGEIDPKDIYVCNLSQWTVPKAGVAVDPVLGRLVASATSFNPLQVSYAFGFSGELGGGPYDRRQAIACWFQPKVRQVDWQAGVLSTAPAGSTQPYPDPVKAVSAWNQFIAVSAPAFGLIAIEDSASYNVSQMPPIVVPAGSRLAIVAAGLPNPASLGEFDPTMRRPHLRGDISVTGTAVAGANDPGDLVLEGLLIEGGLTVSAGNLGGLRIEHSTLLPRSGLASLQVSANAQLEVDVCRSICGQLNLTDRATRLRLEDSIVDGVVSLANPQNVTAIAAQSTPVEMATTTVLGLTGAETLEASNCLFYQAVTVARRQAGCVRFSYEPAASVTPRRFRCQPDLAISAPGAPSEAEVRRKLEPHFTAVDYGSAGYCQLHQSTAPELRTGAEDGSEMGAFSFLKQPQREQNMVAALDEYLRAGLVAGIFYVT
jgi:hypothetical protein